MRVTVTNVNQNKQALKKTLDFSVVQVHMYTMQLTPMFVNFATVYM